MLLLQLDIIIALFIIIIVIVHPTLHNRVTPHNRIISSRHLFMIRSLLVHVPVDRCANRCEIIAVIVIVVIVGCLVVLL